MLAKNWDSHNQHDARPPAAEQQSGLFSHDPPTTTHLHVRVRAYGLPEETRFLLAAKIELSVTPFGRAVCPSKVTQQVENATAC